MGRGHRPVGHLHRRLRRPSIPTHRPHRHVGLQHQERRNASGWHELRFPKLGEPRRTCRVGPGSITNRAGSRPCGSSTSTARSSSSARAVWPEPSAGADADFAADVLDSIRIEQPSTTETVPRTAPPRALPNTSGTEQLAPGTYFVDEVSGTPTPRIFATIGAGWSNPYPRINSTRITEGWTSPSTRPPG